MRYGYRNVTGYSYGTGTALRTVALPTGTKIRYEYATANAINPLRRFRNDTLTAEFAWSDPLRLERYKDHDTLLEYTFSYDDAGVLDTVRLAEFTPEEETPDPDTDWAAASADWLGSFAAQERRRRLHEFLGKRSMPLELLCGCDQVGTLKILTDTSGRLVKEILQDSFGVYQSDSFSDLFIPIGFAGGPDRPGHRPCPFRLQRL